MSGKAPSEMSALQPYRGKPAVRNDRGDRGNVGIIEARSAPRSYPTIGLCGRLRRGLSIFRRTNGLINRTAMSAYSEAHSIASARASNRRPIGEPRDYSMPSGSSVKDEACSGIGTQKLGRHPGSGDLPEWLSRTVHGDH